MERRSFYGHCLKFYSSLVCKLFKKKSLSFHCFSFVLQCLWGFENVSEHTNCQILEIFKIARRRPKQLVKHRSEADFYILNKIKSMY